MGSAEQDRVVIINDRSEMVGGASNLACLLAEKLDQSGIATTFFAGDSPSPYAPIADMIHVCGTPLITKSAGRAFTQGLYNQNAYLRLCETIEKYDTSRTIYHVHGWSKILSPSIFHALNKVRHRTILHAHDYFLACPNGGFANFQRAATCQLKPMSLRCLSSQCDKRGPAQKVWRTARHALRESLFPIKTKPAHVLLIHPGMQTYFDRAGIASQLTRVIRNPVEAILPDGSKPWLNKNFFFIGRLEPEKGIQDAAEAAKRAGATLHVIGDGSLSSYLKSAYPNVIMHGWKNKEEMQPLIKNARAIIMSSRTPEPFGLVAMESITSGIPVIIPETALLAPEIVTAGCGLSFSGGNIESLTAVLVKMAQCDPLIQSMSDNCRKHGTALAHKTETWVDAIRDVYSEVLSHANGHAPIQRAQNKTPGFMTERAAKITL